jgi:hypothetical protein
VSTAVIPATFLSLPIEIINLLLERRDTQNGYVEMSLHETEAVLEAGYVYICTADSNSRA